MSLPSKSEMLGTRREFKTAVLISLVFLAFSFGYSFIGFIHTEPSVHIHEYSPSKLAVELVGHFTFGFFAGLLMFDVVLAMLVGAGAVLIDSDHMLAALNFNVSGRPDHSFLFAAASVVVYAVAANRLGAPNRFFLKVILAGPAVVFSHISFDIFAATSQGVSSFPLLVPFSFDGYYLSYPYWPILEAAAALVSLSAYLVACRLSGPPRRKEQRQRRPPAELGTAKPAVIHRRALQKLLLLGLRAQSRSSASAAA